MSDPPDLPPDPEELENLTPSPINFPVVGIGASAGGLAALLGFFEHMPDGNGMAFVVIIHLSPKHVSDVAEILQRVTKMPVILVETTTAIKANHVYVIPPSHDLKLNDGHLQLTEPTRVRGMHLAIDLFFRTLAQVHNERAIAIVMSGTGSDGAAGLARVKERGGVTLAQSPDDAEFNGMPKAAIATGMVDFVDTAVDMPQRLLDLWANASRIERRLQLNSLPDLPAYRDYLREHPEEAHPRLQDMMTSVTHFFRDRSAFEALEHEVLPGLLKGRLPDDPVRVWVPGCATGEEAYSIAILLREQMDLHHSTAELQIFATDIDERAISVGRNALYPNAIMTDVTPRRLRRFFTPEQDQFRVVKQFREKVLFAQHNVLRDPPFLQLDLVCCRNLLIYLDREAQTRILELFRFALKPEGFLFLGSSETADAATNLFTVVDKKSRIYKANPNAHSMRHLPLMDTPTERIELARQTQTRRDASLPTIAELHRKFIEQIAQPSVLIDAQHNSLHLSENVGKFLLPRASAPSLNLLTNVLPELRRELHIALFQTVQSGQPVKTRAIAVERGESRVLIQMTVRYFGEVGNASGLTLVLFYEAPEEPGEGSRENIDPAQQIIINQLENEIRQLKEHLQETIEQTETSTEDFKASNEELQSINDELTTANFELKVKVDETSKINDDLQNLIISTDIATLLVDRKMRLAEENVRAGEERLRIAAETTQDFAILTMDEKGLITTWNLGAERMYGYQAEEIVGQPFSLIFTPKDRASGAPEQELAHARNMGSSQHERWHVRKNGSTFFCSGVVTPMEGKVKGYAKIARDMTENKAQQMRREELLAREKEANELKDQFLAVMSHELKHPLNLIQVNTELLISQPEVRALPDVLRAGETIRSAVISQTKIIDDLLDMSRARTGKLTLRVTPVDLNELTSLIAAAARDAATHKGVSLDYQCDADDLIALCDRVRTEQVFWNLINNAIKFTPEGGSIAVKLTRDGEFIKFAVADTGLGIASEFLPQVFGMFVQAPQQTSNQNLGLGVGLTLVRDLTVAQGGKVQADSAGLNKGSIFTVWLPLAAAKPQEHDKKVNTLPGNLNGIEILAVDDMIDLLEPFAALLRLEGAHVDIATSGQKALELLDDKSYDLLISDIGMPYMDGYDLIRKIRKRPGLGTLKAIALSGYGRQVDSVRALQSGFNAHLAKPATVAHICQTIAQLVVRAKS